jgi:hypothetical protein
MITSYQRKAICQVETFGNRINGVIELGPPHHADLSETRNSFEQQYRNSRFVGAIEIARPSCE